MRGAIIVFATVGALALAGGTTAGAAGRPSKPQRCAPSQSHVVAIDTQAIVYEAPLTRGARGKVYRGCVFGSTRSLVLGLVPSGSTCGPSSCGGDYHVTLIGDIVAVEFDEVAGSVGETLSGIYKVQVYNLRTRKMLQDVPTGSPVTSRSPNFVGVGQITDLVLKSDGAVAWIAEDKERSIKPQRYFDVYVLDSSGEREVAAGTTVVPNSLAVADSTVYWTDGSTAQSTSID
jgi:hypothetical protein